MTTFESKWSNLEAGKGFKRIDENHPLDFYIGTDIHGEWVLLLLIDKNVSVPTQSQAIQVFCRQRQDKRWALTFKLLRSDLGQLFSHLCKDLVESSRHIQDKSEAAEIVLVRFARWQRLLKSGHTGLLDESVQLGLLGELLFLQRFALQKYGSIIAIGGWVGPLDAEQDFRYPDNLFEVKTVGSEVLKVMISSAEQLDDADRPIQLVVMVLDHADRNDDGALCLSGVIENMRKELQHDAQSLSLFNDRLMSVGYYDREEYGIRFYQLNNIRRFTVCKDFPRIIRSQLPAGIGRVKYELDLHTCLPYTLDDNVGK